MTNKIIEKPYKDDPYAEVELIASTQIYGDKFDIDSMPVLAARVSHADDGKTGDNTEADKKLMKYLSSNSHWSVFEHSQATFRITAPLFVIRQIQRHKSFFFNEQSMRYSEDPVGKFYYPTEWREQATRNKQSSAGSVDAQEVCTQILKIAYDNAIKAYKDLQILGVCREQARIVVPVGNYSSMYMSGNLRSWTHFCNLRVAEDAQWEIRQYANAIDKILLEVYPNSWDCLRQMFVDKIT